MYKYKYTGEDEKHLPSVGVTVTKGQIVETEKPINHPEFVLVTDEPETTAKKVSK